MHYRFFPPLQEPIRKKEKRWLGNILYKGAPSNHLWVQLSYFLSHTETLHRIRNLFSLKTRSVWISITKGLLSKIMKRWLNFPHGYNGLPIFPFWRYSLKSLRSKDYKSKITITHRFIWFLAVTSMQRKELDPRHLAETFQLELSELKLWRIFVPLFPASFLNSWRLGWWLFSLLVKSCRVFIKETMALFFGCMAPSQIPLYLVTLT